MEYLSLYLALEGPHRQKDELCRVGRSGCHGTPVVGTAETEVKGQEEGGHKGEQGTQDKVRMCFINVLVILLVRKSRNYYQSCCEIMVLLLHV